METQIKSYIMTKKGIKLITIFGYATKSVPGLEINGVGKLAKNIKEKLIFITRTRKLKMPTKKFVICIDLNDLEEELKPHELKWLEFPILLLFWYLAGHIPIRSLEDCLCTGWIHPRGDIYQTYLPQIIKSLLQEKLNPVEMKEVKIVSCIVEDQGEFLVIDSDMLLEHIGKLKFKIDYIDKASAIPIKSFIA